MKRDAGKETAWRQAVAELEGSGQSVREFCRHRGLKEGQLYAWRRELRVRDGQGGAPAGFVELVGPAGGREWTGVSIRVDERLRVVVERGFDRETLKATLGCLCAGPAAARGAKTERVARAQGAGTQVP